MTNILGQCCLTSTLWFFLTWFAIYRVDYRGMYYIESGLVASLPFIISLAVTVLMHDANYTDSSALVSV